MTGMMGIKMSLDRELIAACFVCSQLDDLGESRMTHCRVWNEGQIAEAILTLLSCSDSRAMGRRSRSPSDRKRSRERSKDRSDRHRSSRRRSRSRSPDRRSRSHHRRSRSRDRSRHVLLSFPFLEQWLLTFTNSSVTFSFFPARFLTGLLSCRRHEDTSVPPFQKCSRFIQSMLQGITNIDIAKLLSTVVFDTV